MKSRKTVISSNDIVTQNGIEYLDNIFKNIKVDNHIELPSEWTSQHRHLNSGISNRPGLINHQIAPHLVEIMDCFHPYSGIKSVTVMKSTQSLVTTMGESVIGWSIRNSRHNILYLISNRNIGKVRLEVAIDTMIDDSGLKDYIKKHSERKRNALAESGRYKQLSGRKRLMIGSYGSIADAKSLPWDLIIFDELDEAPAELKKQGDAETIFTGRTTTAKHAKILKISTPTTTDGRIYKNFMAGDQRYYYVPCPVCGEMQVLELWSNQNEYGLRAEYETKGDITNIIPDSVRYICKFCNAQIEEYNKGWMLNNGLWKPTAFPESREYRSYHISGLMSPVFAFSWQQVCQRFLECNFGKDFFKFKNFKIDVLGLPWEKRDENITPQKLYEQSDTYPLEVMPSDTIVIVAGCDVQKNRLEVQTIAIGKQMKIYVIDYKQFFGTTADENDLCWSNLQDYITNFKFTWKANKTRTISQCAIDTGYNPSSVYENEKALASSNAVYKNCFKNWKLIPVSGNGKDITNLFSIVKVHNNDLISKRIDLNSTLLKELIYDDITNGRILFTKRLTPEYFQGLISETQVEERGKRVWKKTYRRNEPLDTLVYARGLAHYMGISQWSNEQWDELEQEILGEY